jgi:hypothetical protein
MLLAKKAMLCAKKAPVVCEENVRRKGYAASEHGGIAAW